MLHLICSVSLSNGPVQSYEVKAFEKRGSGCDPSCCETKHAGRLLETAK